MAIGEICSRETVFTTRETTVATAARLMRHHHVGTLVVVEERKGGARESGGVLETMQIMRYKGARRLPIVDKDGQLVGIVSFDDLLEVLAEQLTQVSKIVAREQGRE